MAWLMAAITTVTPVHTDPTARGGGACGAEDYGCITWVWADH